MQKCLASRPEIEAEPFLGIMREVNALARLCGLHEYTTYSRLWEYPWLWRQLEPLSGQHLRLLDLGSEASPFPWFLASKGFRVVVSDLTPAQWRLWSNAKRQTRARVTCRLLDAQAMDVPTAGIDIYLSVSVIEHVPDKRRALSEAARILRPGGLFVSTFDICQPEMGMTFPAWNGKALSMEEFDSLFRESPWFERGLAEIKWNREAIPEYLTWHRRTAPHHNYVTGAAVVRRTAQVWRSRTVVDLGRTLRGMCRPMVAVPPWYAKTMTVRCRNRLLGAMTGPEAARAVGSPLYFLAGRRADKKISLKSARAILVVRLDAIGDVVLTTPFLRELRRNAPGGWITLVVNPEVFNLVELCPYVNEIVTFDGRVSGRASALKRHSRALRLAATRLWRRRFDLAILPRWDADYYHATYLTYFSGASRRVGYSERVLQRKRELNAGTDRLLTDVIDHRAAKHEVERNLDVLRFLGANVSDDRLGIWLDEEDRSFAGRVCAGEGIGPHDLVVAFAPGAGDAKRCWPIERFVELGRLLVREYDARLAVVGGPGDRQLGGQLQSGLGPAVLNLAGRTTLRETAGVLERCELAVTTDSGPMHLAAAAGSAVVEISCHPRAGDTEHYNSPVRFHPWGVPYAVLQPEHAADGCRDSCESSEPHCILGIQPDQVLEAVRGLVRAGEPAHTTTSGPSAGTARSGADPSGAPVRRGIT